MWRLGRTALMLLGAAYLAAGEAGKATELFRKAVALAPQSPRALSLLGGGLSAQGRSREARAEFEAALALKPDDLAPLVGLVRMAHAERNPDAALERVKRQLNHVPTSAPLHYLLGIIHLLRGAHGAAEQALLHAIALDPRLLDAYLALGHLYAVGQRYEEALVKLEQARKVDPKHLGTAMLIGMIHERRGAIAEAQAAYEGVLELHPRFGPAANNLAYLYAEHGGDPEKALALAQTAREIFPENPQAADTLGWILYKRGAYRQALKLLRESASKLPDHPQVQYHLGMTYASLGNRDAARQALAKALALDPPVRRGPTGTTPPRGDRVTWLSGEPEKMTPQAVLRWHRVRSALRQVLGAGFTWLSMGEFG